MGRLSSPSAPASSVVLDEGRVAGEFLAARLERDSQGQSHEANAATPDVILHELERILITRG